MMSFSLLLLLLIIKDFNIGSYAEFYFMKLNKTSEKESFLNHFKDKIVTDFLNGLTILFINHTFNADEIRHFVREKLKWNNEKEFEKIMKKISVYHRQFYLDKYAEWKESPELNKLDEELKKNSSFRFVTSEDETDLELFYMDLYFEANKSKMTDEEIQQFMLKRILKATSNRDYRTNS
jgi:hypothetical protein